jgi:hypothetical protein
MIDIEYPRVVRLVIEFGFHLVKHKFKKSTASQAQTNLVWAPYLIMQRVGSNAFKLDPPPRLNIHHAMNVSQLRLY